MFEIFCHRMATGRTLLLKDMWGNEVSAGRLEDDKACLNILTWSVVGDGIAQILRRVCWTMWNPMLIVQ